MLYKYRRPVFAALAIALLAFGLRAALPLVPLLWQGSHADAHVVEREPLSVRSYRATLEFARDGQAELVRVSREFTGSRGSRWLTVGAPVRIVHSPDNPNQLLVLSYPGADWLAPTILLTAGMFFAVVWRKTNPPTHRS